MKKYTNELIILSKPLINICNIPKILEKAKDLSQHRRRDLIKWYAKHRRRLEQHRLFMLKSVTCRDIMVSGSVVRGDRM